MASIQNVINADLHDVTFVSGMKSDVYTADAGGAAFTLPDDTAPVCLIDAGGASMTLTLPTVAAAANRILFLFNTADGIETITVKDSTGVTTVATLAQNKATVLYCNGTTWHAIVGGIA